MSCLSPAPPRGLQAVIPIDPPPSKREKVALYLNQKKEQFEQYQKLLKQQGAQLAKQRQAGLGRNDGGPRRLGTFSRLMSTSSFTTYARAAQQQEDELKRSLNSADSDSALTAESEAKNLSDKNGEKLVMFPSYARRLDNGLVEIDIRGWIYAAGLPNRKNRIFTSLVRQLVGVEEQKPDQDGTGAEADADNPEQNSVNAQSTASSSKVGSASPFSTARYNNVQNNKVGSVIPKNSSSISVGSVLASNGRGSPSPSRRGSTSLNSTLIRPQSPSAAVRIPRSGRRGASDRSYSPGTSPAYGSPRSNAYSPARMRGMADDSAVFNSNRFVQPSFAGDRQPLLSQSPNGGARSPGYFSEIESDAESDYFSESEDEFVVDNHHETVVIQRSSPPPQTTPMSYSTTPTGPRPSDIRAQQSLYRNNAANSSMVSIAGHNSEVVAQNADNAPLSTSFSATKGSYFPDYSRRGSLLNLTRTFSTSNASGFRSPGPSTPGIMNQNFSFASTPGGINPNFTLSSSASTSPANQEAISDSRSSTPPPLPARPALISFATMYNAEKVLQERIAPFISRPISAETVTINVGSTDSEQYSTYNVITTDSGHFGVRLRLGYDPELTCVECDDLITVNEIKVIEPYGVSLISDVDDTIKHTGITGEKKGIFRNVFVKDFSELEIKGVAEWYQRLSKIGVPMHYVSNSPWQLFPSIAKFIRKAGLPAGSMHLKYYTGFLYGLLEPAVEKKRFNLESILTDFPHRKFILVGDSGEMDLEAYVNLACNFPNQVLVIYIRDVTTLCNDNDMFCEISEFNGFFASSVPRPDEIDYLLEDDPRCFVCGGKSDPDRYYNRPHSPPPLMPKPQSLRGNKITTQPTATSTEWSLSPSPELKDNSGVAISSISQQQQLHEQRQLHSPTPEVPKIPKKPSNLRSQPINAQRGEVAGGAQFDLMSTSVASTISPIAERMAAYSSTFASGSPESPDKPSYLSLKGKPQSTPKPANATTGLLSAGLKGEANGAQDYRSIAGGDNSGSQEDHEVEEHDRKPPLPPRPASLLRSVAGAAVARAHEGHTHDYQHASDMAAITCGSCFGRQQRGRSARPRAERPPEPTDKKLALWKRRVARARMMLPNGIRLRMWRIGDDVADECEEIVREYLDNINEGSSNT
ncbi:uncharacterized protein V1516DRAFT_553596 [Lipomyces oligophaga]|uniref:uncharacterized protein n=1 Tax=Lipomyces oligophaga TaxID=45792 RepID=UPI0034CD3E58